MKLMASFFGKAYLILAVALITVFFGSQLWKSEKIIEWDITLYYSYLPATFIYHDLEFNDRDPIWDEKLFFMNTDEEGHRYVKMTSGLAYLYAPFFFGAHAFALAADYPANGFSLPYQFALMLSALLFGLLGLWYLGKLLMRWFSEKVAFLTLLVIFAGTNLAYYTFASPMSHVYNFALVSMFLYWFFQYIDRQRLKHMLLMGLVGGLLVLIRPTNIIALLFPLITLIGSSKRINLPKLGRHLLPALGLAVLVWLPQLWYWHHMTGHWLVYSYNGETFFFNDPEIWKGLFSYRKGWFVYSPVLVFSVGGFVVLFKNHVRIAWAALITMVICLYITFSWWCWWYGGGFGARSLIEFLPFMAMAMAGFIGWLIQKKWWIQVPAFLVMGYFCFTSVFMSNQYVKGIIHFDAMSKELFWKQYLVGHYIRDYAQYLDPPDYAAAARNEE